MNTDTPKTDALQNLSEEAFRDVDILPADIFDLARTLERELSAKSAECQRLRELLSEAIGYLSQDDDCEVIACVSEARAALQEVTP